jgi:TolB protein
VNRVVSSPALDIETLPFLHESQRDLVRLHPDWVTFEPFAPVGTPIVFERFDPHTGTRQIHSMNADGSDVANLSRNPAYHDGTPAWSPDRTKIVFARAAANAGIYSLWLMNPDGTQQVQLTTPPAGKWDVEPIWSPDGSKLAFTRFYEIWTCNRDGSNAQPLIDYDAKSPVADHMPTWRSDSRAIAFCREWLGFGIIAVAETTTPSPVVRYVTAPNKGRWDAWPAWSPKSDRIAFTRNDYREMQVWTIDAGGDTATERPLSHPDSAHGVFDQAPCWSNDGMMLGFHRTQHVTQHIWTMDADGGNQEDLSAIGKPYGDPSDFFPNWA